MLFSVIKLILMTIIIACTNSFRHVLVQFKKNNIKTRIYSGKEYSVIENTFITGKKLRLKGNKLEEFVIEFTKIKEIEKNNEISKIQMKSLEKEIEKNKEISNIQMKILEKEIEKNKEINTIQMKSLEKEYLLQLNITIGQSDLRLERLLRLQSPQV
mmetsp:Transcript_12472/g.11306  ORF Transcript_12472/g.11306 Transcript_12472/m.11306 type:complete len:157 (-) Transcript_12472:298-768(-)